MRPLSWWYHNALAGLLDAAAGMSIVAALCLWYGRPVEPEWLALGAILALLPDFDMVPGILRGRVVGDHRAGWLHAPLVVIPVVMLASFILGGGFWALAAFACLLWHYAHDTTDGVTWGRPFSPYYWSYSGRAVRLGPTHATWLEETWGQESRRAWAELPLALLFAIFAWAAVLLA